MLATLNSQHQKIQNLQGRLARLSTMSPPKSRPQQDLSKNGAISHALQDILARIDLLGAQLQGASSPNVLSRSGALNSPRSAARQCGRSASDHLHVHYWAGLPRVRPPLERNRQRRTPPPLLAVSASSAAPVGHSGCGPLPALPSQKPSNTERNAASAHTPQFVAPFATQGPLPGTAALTITPFTGDAVGCVMRSPSAPPATTLDTCADSTAAWRMAARCADKKVFEELGRMVPQPRDLAVAYGCPCASEFAPSRDAVAACARPRSPIQISSAGPPTASRGSCPQSAHTAGTNSAHMMNGRRAHAVAARITRDAPPVYERWLPEVGHGHCAAPSGVAGDEYHRPSPHLGGIEASAALHQPTAGQSPPKSMAPCFADPEEPVALATVSQRGAVGPMSPSSVGPCYSKTPDRDNAMAWAVFNAQQAAAGAPLPTSTEHSYAEAADVDEAMAWAK